MNIRPFTVISMYVSQWFLRHLIKIRQLIVSNKMYRYIIKFHLMSTLDNFRLHINFRFRRAEWDIATIVADESESVCDEGVLIGFKALLRICLKGMTKIIKPFNKSQRPVSYDDCLDRKDLSQNLKQRHLMSCLDVEVRTILKWDFNKWDKRVWTKFA